MPSLRAEHARGGRRDGVVGPTPAVGDSGIFLGLQVGGQGLGLVLQERSVCLGKAQGGLRQIPFLAQRCQGLRQVRFGARPVLQATVGLAPHAESIAPGARRPAGERLVLEGVRLFPPLRILVHQTEADFLRALGHRDHAGHPAKGGQCIALLAGLDGQHGLVPGRFMVGANGERTNQEDPKGDDFPDHAGIPFQAHVRQQGSR
jgi:hypothetical protein